MRIKQTEVAMPSHTAVCAVFLPYSSLAISVTRKVEAKRMLPSVISMPKASMTISTSMFAAIVATTVHKYSPCSLNKANKSRTAE